MALYYPFVLRCLEILDMLASSAIEFWGWLTTEVDASILGVIAPIELISFSFIGSFLIVRIILALNS